jgi:hypothetical protein
LNYFGVVCVLIIGIYLDIQSMVWWCKPDWSMSCRNEYQLKQIYGGNAFEILWMFSCNTVPVVWSGMLFSCWLKCIHTLCKFVFLCYC